MLTFTLIYDNEEKEVFLPQTWSDVTFEQYVRLVNEDNYDEKGNIDILNRIHIFTGIPIEALERCKQELILTMFNCISFMADQDEIINCKVPADLANWEYEGISYGTGIAIDKILDNNYKALVEDIGREPTPEEVQKHRINAGASIVEVLTRKKVGDNLVGRNILKEPVTEVLGMVNFFLTRLEGLDTSTG